MKPCCPASPTFCPRAQAGLERQPDQGTGGNLAPSWLCGVGLAGAKPVLLGRRLLPMEPCFCLGSCGPFWSASLGSSLPTPLSIFVSGHESRVVPGLANGWGIRSKAKGAGGESPGPRVHSEPPDFLRPHQHTLCCKLMAGSWRESRVHTYGSATPKPSRWEETKPESHPSSV